MQVKNIKNKSIIFSVLFDASGDVPITRHQTCCSIYKTQSSSLFGDAYNPQTIQTIDSH